MSQPINRYKADLREYQFVLFEQFQLDEILGEDPYTEWGVDEVKMILDEVYRFNTEVTGPLNAVGDAQGCRIEGGQVHAPEGFKDAWKQLYEAGHKLLSVSPEFGGSNAPNAVSAVTGEIAAGANTAFDMYPGLTMGAAELIESFGTPEQRERYCLNMFSGKWSGTMCLTEPQAGSDVGLSSTSATKNDDGTYSITGTKIYISGGDHDLTENIVHMVLARTPDAPPGTKGLSLFIVPKYAVNSDGSVGDSNDVACPSIEHKMGINGSATAVLQFGDNGKCVGELLGTVEQKGIAQMFQMMNYARIGVGLQGLAIMSTAYLNALEYAKDRKQGAHISNWKDPEAPRVPIIQHPDVRRMLLDMKARVEGIRALVIKGAMHGDKAEIYKGKDDEKAAYHQGQLELMTPLIKAYASDQAFAVCETAIQTLGGAGYTRDFPIEQYCRDSKIFSIYEGTNHIQALDLVGRKLGMNGGKNAQSFMADVGKFVGENSEHPDLADCVKALGGALEDVTGCAMQFMAWFQGGELAKVPLVANRFLQMLSEVTVGWLLLDAAVIAIEKQKSVEKDHPDWAFYEGKKASARYWANNVLPLTKSMAQVVQAADTSAMDIPDAAFASA